MTWRVNLDYELGGSSMVYGNVTTGYRSGGFNLPFFSQTAEYEPEEMIAYEIGIREISRHPNSEGFRRTTEVTEPRLWGIEVMYSMN